jgi:hypothetical protein
MDPFVRLSSASTVVGFTVELFMEAAGRRRPGFGRETVVLRTRVLAELRRRGMR